MWDEAAEDGRSCVKVNKNFIKGYFRLAVALRSAGKYKEAVDNIKMGLAVDPGNADLKKQSSEMEELMRKDRVVALVAKAKEQMQGGELKDCLATCDRGLALDGGNKELTKIKGTVQPKFEAAEKRRVGSLSKNARDKELGDQAYKNADFEGAIMVNLNFGDYEEAIAHLPSLARKGDDGILIHSEEKVSKLIDDMADVRRFE